MTIELNIETLTHGGRGLGRHQGKAIFVPQTAPGDRVRVDVQKEKPRYAVAELVELIEPSTVRHEPPCPYAGSCGGCQWQHLPYAEQLRWKERIFRDMLVREQLLHPDAFQPIVPSEHELGYRNRVQFKCRQTCNGFVAGFYRHGSHFVVDIDRCLLVDPAIHQVYTRLRQLLPGSPAPQSIPQIDIACDDQGQVHAILHALPEGREPLQTWWVDVAAAEGFNASLQSGRKQTLVSLHGANQLDYAVDQPRMSLQVRAGGFTQVNSHQNRILIADLLELAALQGGESVLDLFCGMGNFSLPLARRARQVIGVENYAPAIEDAVANAERNGLANTRFLAEDASGALQRLAAEGFCFDLLTLDPPRSGCYQVMRDILEVRPSRVIYVSCDPASLARDLKPLVHNGYRIVSSRPYDLFPQTWHIESMTLLERAE